MPRLPVPSRPFVLAVAIGVAAACAQFVEDPLGPDPSLSPDTVGSAALTADLQRWPADRLEFREVRITGDTLVATVSYGGGCREHRFALVFADVFLESYPVQVHGLLAHDSGGDPCRALLTRTLRYDLAPLRRAYREGYRQETGSIVLHGNWTESLRYDF